ncbi:hypothetical protein [Cyclobacterium jeungdonense]|uniref:Uncharacterized protein n=1 Tax=Cyclobacterium jeungdonense TaxID=708087 RepID=A0ABT8C563_9BACT|nr:hypothetical protein [Cyclobacterium jeungdonense]MDN3686866.1 hypothetical protein [Cyclobacterium jeungdonense]
MELFLKKADTERWFPSDFIRVTIFIFIVLLCPSFSGSVSAQPNHDGAVISQADLDFLAIMTRDVLEQSRIYPNQVVSDDFGANGTGGTLIRPGGRDAYPSFWIRDYAMALETGMISLEEKEHMFLLTAAAQADQSWITSGGSLIPLGSIPDHIRIDDGLPIYFPGTYSYELQGTKEWGSLPPFGDAFFFIHMAHHLIEYGKEEGVLEEKIEGKSLMDRLLMAFHVSPSRQENQLVYCTVHFRGVDFGFRDAIQMTGDLLYPSVLKFRAAKQLANIFDRTGNEAMSSNYSQIAKTIQEAVPEVFHDASGLLKASTGSSNQPDVWGTALAVYEGVLQGEARDTACRALAEAYENGTLSYRGNIRHVLTDHDFDSDRVWEKSMAPKNQYQNGAYWGTPVSWVVHAIYQVNPGAARKLVSEYITELKENDFRKGAAFGAPYECFNPDGYTQNPVYLTSVASPLAVFLKMMRDEK